jgi:hypothetical protein
LYAFRCCGPRQRHWRLATISARKAVHRALLKEAARKQRHIERDGAALAHTGHGRRVVEGTGFEPVYAKRADLQSAGFNHSPTPPQSRRNERRPSPGASSGRFMSVPMATVNTHCNGFVMPRGPLGGWLPTAPWGKQAGSLCPTRRHAPDERGQSSSLSRSRSPPWSSSESSSESSESSE